MPGGRVLLLRGVNVGGHRRLPMAELRERVGRLGGVDVRTYLQSGNVVVAGGPADLAARLADELGTPVLERTAAALQEVVDGNPFPEVADPTRLVAVFLSRPVPAAAQALLAPAATAPDRVRPAAGVLYVHYPRGQAGATLSAATLARVDPAATARNWRTVLALREMSAG